jgi:hypothetical protein
MEKAGATDMNGTTQEDRTNYFENVPTSAFDLALWLESDRMVICSVLSIRRNSTRSAESFRMRSGRGKTSRTR